MKYLSIFCIAIITLLSSASRSVTVRDSVYADSVYGEFAVNFSSSALGYPDKSYATFSGGALLDLAFRAYGSTTIRTIQSGATIKIWGKKDESVDTSAAKVIFFKTDQFGAPLYESQPYYIDSGLNTIVVDQEYTYFEVTLTGNEINPGSKGYMLDGALLLQNRDSTAGGVQEVPGQQIAHLVTSYPNPFKASLQRTNVVIHLDRSGEAVLQVIDMLGREVAAVSLGMLSEGDYTIPVSVPNAQRYLAVLKVDGYLTGAPLRLTAE